MKGENSLFSNIIHGDPLRADPDSDPKKESTANVIWDKG
jgi:hypothetical protein